MSFYDKPKKPLKRSPFKKKLPDFSKPNFLTRPRKPLKKTKIRVVGHSEVSEIKQEIQDTLRQICILRDGKCILFGIKCRHQYGDGEVYQAEHLVERSNSETYGDPRLVVLVAKPCHGWKHFNDSNKEQYDKWVRTKISKERVELWDKCKADHWKPKKTGSYDWKLVLLALKQELRKLQNAK